MRTDRPSPKVTIIVHDGNGKLTTHVYDSTIHAVAEVIDAGFDQKGLRVSWEASMGVARGPKPKKEANETESQQADNQEEIFA